MAKMFSACSFKSPFLIFCYRFLFKILKSLIGLHRTLSNTPDQCKHQKYLSLVHRSDVSGHTLIFDVEGALLRSSSLFPYFMLVAFEAGGLLRALVLMVTYPFVCLVGDEMRLKIMVMISFFGIKADSFRVGRAVLPKFLLEEVGSEIFEVLRRGGKKVGVSNLPQVMVESFLREYLQIDFVVGRELKVFCGYFVGLMEHSKITRGLEQVREGKGCSDIIAITGFNKILNHELLSQCKEIYMVSEADKRNWQKLERNKYPKALIFHDGRLAVRPTPLHSLAILMWLPFGLFLAFIRSSIGLSLPYNISTPLLAVTGLHHTLSIPKTSHSKHDDPDPNPNGQLYVCNHRTLLDPLYLSFMLKKNLIAVTYSLSRMSEILAPIRTVRLTRDRDQDAMIMKKALKQGDVVVCPEGTTCREPYLLRFSPLFSETCDEIAPVALDSHVSMFHGTTAGGCKCLDPLFFLSNPFPIYSVRLLQKVCGSSAVSNDENARFEVANYVQREIGKTLGFECTGLTRRDKYLILAGSEGIVSS